MALILYEVVWIPARDTGNDRIGLTANQRLMQLLVEHILSIAVQAKFGDVTRLFHSWSRNCRITTDRITIDRITIDRSYLISDHRLGVLAQIKLRKMGRGEGFTSGQARRWTI